MPHSPLSLKKIFLFFLPLSITWFMMAGEGQFTRAIISRAFQPTYNLAAFGIAFAIVVFIESPVIMMLSTSAVFTKNKQSYVRLRHFTIILSLVITAIITLVLYKSVFHFIANQILSLPENLTTLTRISGFLLLPLPLAVGYRRFNNGILIRYHQMHAVAIGTGIRIATMVSVGFLLLTFTDIPGAYMASIALSSGITLEAIMSRVLVHKIICRIYSKDQESPAHESDLSYREILTFFIPLALTASIGTAIQPLTTYFLAKGLLSLESLAVFPLVASFVFLFACFSFSFQEVVLALLGEKMEEYRALFLFMILLALSTVLSLCIFSLSPLSHLWYTYAVGLPGSLIGLAVSSTKIQILLPALLILRNWQQGVLICSKRTTIISTATILEFLVIGISLYVLIEQFNIIGAVAAGYAFLFGALVANLVLVRSHLHVLAEKQIHAIGRKEFLASFPEPTP